MLSAVGLELVEAARRVDLTRLTVGTTVDVVRGVVPTTEVRDLRRAANRGVASGRVALHAERVHQVDVVLVDRRDTDRRVGAGRLLGAVDRVCSAVLAQ